MRWRSVRGVVLGVLALGSACDAAAPAAEDAAPPPDAAADAQLPCTATGEVLGFDGSTAHRLNDGDELPVILGFQGFIFIEVGLRSPEPLDAFVSVQSNARLTGGASVADTHPGIGTEAGPGGTWETRKVLVFFNDFPPAELYGRDVELALSAPAATCRLRASVRGRLVEGGVQLQDSGVE